MNRNRNRNRNKQSLMSVRYHVFVHARFWMDRVLELPFLLLYSKGNKQTNQCIHKTAHTGAVDDARTLLETDACITILITKIE